MATVEQKVCDVFGTTKETESYRVFISKPQGIGQDDEVVMMEDVDLCPKALIRLKNFVKKGVHEPLWKKPLTQ